ncbi:aminotransferase class IV [Corynebacterium comes]|uniref:Aminotransferase class IV n=1 Tax=Corynebacterium comes TaxID=2675218 RepID=A0A6B8WB88_9CORY|nr:aminotransferase class IV [Corynebacterium comes]QGU04128.1 hypothetical protein CETAM_04285 [Corynebacterium comes]
MTGTLWRWDGSGLVAAEEPESSPDVVDSWLEHDGYVGSWHLHRERFSASLPGLDVTDFLAAVRPVVPHQGQWFPRIEAHGDDLYLRVRPAPSLRTSTVLHVPSRPDARRSPRVKGPDLALLADLRSQAQALGADDAVLYSADGLVSEGANCALAWWEEGRLMVPAHPDQLPSVTVAATAAICGGLGRRPVTAEELMRHPVWAGSALHGWTIVTGWVMADGEHLAAVTGETPTTTSEMNTLLRWD